MAQQKRSGCIGIFDSGFGGLHILRGIIKTLPQYNYIYLGDTARMPYGTRSEEMVRKFTVQAVDFLFQNGCELVILACNTASSDALRNIQQIFIPKYYPDKKVLGVLIPTAEEAAQKTVNEKVGVIATERTVASRAYMRELTKLNPRIQVFQQPCPLLVPIVEAGEHNSKIAGLILEQYLRPLLKKKVDTIILGCTHYGILERKIKNIVGSRARIVNGAIVVPKKLKLYLKKHADIEKNLGKNGIICFYSTDLTYRFKTFGSQFFGKDINIKKAIIA